MRSTRHQIVRRLVDLGMVEMGPDGRWRLSQAGEQFLEELDLMRDLSEVAPPGLSSRRDDGTTRPPAAPDAKNTSQEATE